MSFLSIASVNVNGLRNDFKRNVFFEFLKRHKYSIVFVQETHSEEGDESVWTTQWQGKTYFNHGNRQSRGVAIFISDKLNLEITDIDKDKEGRWIKGNIKWNNELLSIASVYAPNELYARAQFFDSLCDRIDLNRYIIGGDFNCNIDKNTTDPSKIIMQNVLNEKDILDVWRTVHPDEPGYTHYHKVTKKPSRIDYILTSSNLINNVTDITVYTHGLSDHHVLNMKINNPQVCHGNGRWICNNSLLKEDDCILRINIFWKYWSTQKMYHDTLLEWWEIGKFRIKEIIQGYGKEKSRKQNHKHDVMQKQYISLINDPEKSKVDAIKDLEAQLKKYELDEWEKAKIRVRNVVKNEGEKPSKFFLNMEKQQINNGKIDKLVTSEGQYLDEPSSMLNLVNGFYSNLYTAEDISVCDLNEIVSKIETKDITNEVSENLDSDLTKDEVKLALFQMNKNKSPGLDGLTVEFYQSFWSVISDDFIAVLNDCYKIGQLCKSMNIGLIRLIYKMRGSKFDLKNWRPISLLNVDYKLLAKVLTNRLKQAMPFIIGDEQTCGVPGRKIHDNLTLLRDSIDYINWNNKEAAVLCIDQEKAFDRINWNYMFTMLEKLGIPPKFIQWVKLLYSNPVSCVIVNNFIGRPFQVSRGIRQGCPLSPLLYAVCAEGLGTLIRINNGLHGIQCPGGTECVKIIQHADDATVFISKESDFQVITDVLCNYCKGSGSKVNTSKTTGLWLGNWKNRKDKPCGFNWNNDKLKILGILFGNNVTPANNWDPVISKLKCKLNMFRQRDLNLAGKAVIVNVMVGSRLNYVGSIVSCPEECVKKIENIIFSFYWSGKPDKIKRATITGPRYMGGTGLLDVRVRLRCLKLMWLSNYIKSNSKWKSFFNYWIEKPGESHSLGWYVFGKTKKKSLQTTPFYTDLFAAYDKSGGVFRPDLSSALEVMNIPLWNNSVVTVNKDKVLASNVLKRNNIVKFQHVVKNNRLITFKELARKCKIHPINAGRIVKRLEQNINPVLFKEKRCGPNNHPSRWLKFQIDPGDEGLVPFSKVTTKLMYKSLKVKDFVPPKAQEKWASILGLSVNFDWANIWTKLNMNNIMDAKDKDILFRLYHRILPTRDKLNRMEITDRVDCPFCKSDTETVEHLFLYCNKMVEPWLYVESLIRKQTGCRFFCLSDCIRILCMNLSFVSMIIVSIMINVIWRTRCDLVFNEDKVFTTNIIKNYKEAFRSFLLRERNRLKTNSFNKLYKSLCVLNEDETPKFTF